MRQPEQRSRFIALAWIAAAVAAVHLPDMLRTITDANEGLYAVVARELLHGNLPYVTAWEAKPPVFFVPIAIAMWLFGSNFLALHLLAALGSFVTCACVYLIGNRCGDQRHIGLVAAILCATLLGSDNGTSIEGESLGNAFFAAAFAFLTARDANRTLSQRNALAGGICAGFGVTMKITLAPIALAAIACALPDGIAACIAGAVAPTILGALPYVVTGRVPLWLDANVLTVVRRVGVTPAHPTLLAVARQQLEAFFPAWLAALGAYTAWRTDRDAGARRTLLCCAAWLAAAFLCVLAVREFFGYQWTSLMPPLSIVAAWAALTLADSVPRQRLAAQILVAVALLAHLPGHYAALGKRDEAAEVAAALERLPHPGGAWLYVAAGNAALYLLTGAPLPTRYPYAPHLYGPAMQRAAGVDGDAEIARIFLTAPAIVVVSRGNDEATAAFARIRSNLRRDYVRAKIVDGNEIFELRRSNSRAYSTAVRSAILR